MPDLGTLLAEPDRAQPAAPAKTNWTHSAWAGLLTALTLLTLLVQGYHPFAEDGGVYVAGVEITLDPKLFPRYTAFVREHLRFSVFAPVMAALIHLTHLSLADVLLGVELASLWLTFYAARQILRRCGFGDTAQLAGLTLLAVWATLPVAGTSLLLIDPYVTARSLSTPLSLWAVAFAMDDWSPASRGRRSLYGCLACLILAGLFHPLMAAYALALIIFQRAARLRTPARAWAALTLFALLLAAVLQALARPESPAIVAASYSRYYWFLSQWQWFELLGLAGPLLILGGLAASRRPGRSAVSASPTGPVTPHGVPAGPADASSDGTRATLRTLCRAGVALGLTAILVALVFAREGERAHVVARLQPLRIFLLLYALMALLLGAWLAEILPVVLQAWVSRRAPGRALPAFLLPAMAALVLLLLGGLMFMVQRRTFPASQHLELPWRAAHNPNPWTQAFLWARAHTPRDALFALNAKYVNEDGEDAQTFRATAERSAIPDFSKDGGEAAITPALAGLWQQGAAAQVNLSTESDSVRDARLRPFGVTWMVLHSSAVTRHPCPYDNGTVKVCRLTP